MTADLLFRFLLRAQIASAIAVVVVLLLRAPARRLIGAELTYRLWSAAPVAALVSLFPGLPDYLKDWSSWSLSPTPLDKTLSTPYAAEALWVWMAGGLVLAGLMAVSEASFRRRARMGVAGPAVMGVSWPRIVTPSDYTLRFTAAERELIDRHERVHIARRHPHANLFIAAMQVLGWFNPLVHVAAVCARMDQELACDAAVIEAWPDCRRDYGATLLKAHLARPRSPLACAWAAGARHPLEVRLTMLAKRPLSLAHYMRGATFVGLMAFLVAGVVWTAV
jgi:beta-lactamase regulating signal transducer with metallopeptidase domain